MLIRRLIREMLASEEYVYHVSPSSEISKFEPREFWFSDDGSESGISTGEEVGGRREKLVYASPLEWAPFYSLPRDTPRAVVAGDETDIIDSLSEMGIELRSDSMNLLVEGSDIPSLKSHKFTVYAFDKADFSPLNGDIEWVSRRGVSPVSKETLADSTRYLRENGWNLVPVEGLGEIVGELREQGHFVNSEGV